MEFEKQKLEWWEFDLLSPYQQLSHGVFLRHGGVSLGPFAFLNASDAVGDHPDSVKVNREILRKSLAIDHLVFPKQMHGTKIVEITRENMHKEHEADIFVTKEQGIGLAITHADCQAALIFDSHQEIVGALHAGWRGLVEGIYPKTIAFFQEKFHSSLKDIIVTIAPSLGPDHAEFKNYKKEFPESFWTYQTKKPFHFDLWEIAHKQLISSGIEEKNLEIMTKCTFCNPKDLYSHRRDKTTGRNATIIALKS